MTYNTKQKDLIIEAIKQQQKEFTIKDLYKSLDTNIGLSTIYRLIDKMILDGKIKKTISKDNNIYYQYLEECTEENHFYLKCDSCKKVIHIDCDCINELYKHINRKHHFNLNKENIIINGLCSKCKKEAK